MTCFAIQEYIYTFSVVVIMSVHVVSGCLYLELLIHWSNDLFCYTGVHLYIFCCCNNVSSCQELLIHWSNDLFYYTGLHLLLINKLNNYNSKKDLSSKPASRSTTFEFNKKSLYSTVITQ